MNLTEATMLALQGKLLKESIDVSVDDNGATIVETDEATVIVTDNNNITPSPVEDEEVIEVPVETDETIVPEEDIPSIDEIVDEEEVVEECNQIEEEKEKKEESVVNDGDCTFTLKLNCNNAAFGVDEEGETDEHAIIKEVSRILNKIATELTYTDKKNILDINGNEVGVYGFGYEGVMSPLDEAKECIDCEEKEKKEESSDATNEFVNDLAELLKKHTRTGVTGMELSEDGNIITVTFENGTKKEVSVEADSTTAAIKDVLKKVENVNIEVSEDGKEVEVTTTEGEEVEVKDETETEEVTDIEEPVEDETDFIEESFEKFLNEYYKNNTKSVKNFKLESVKKSNKGLKIEGTLTNKLNKSVKAEMKATVVKEGKFYTRYSISNIKGLLEGKTTTEATLLTRRNKENKVECTAISSKKIVK